MATVKQDEGDDQIIKPENIGPKLDTSEWPLLLRNWDQCMLTISSRSCACTLLRRSAGRLRPTSYTLYESCGHVLT